MPGYFSTQLLSNSWILPQHNTGPITYECNQVLLQAIAIETIFRKAEVKIQ